MKSDEELLTAEQKQQELDVISECFRLMQSERSRYEKQAIAFIDSGHFSTETNSYIVDSEFGIFFNLEEVSHWMIPTKPE